MYKKNKELLDQAAAKAREAARRDSDVKAYQDLADDGEKTVQRLCNLLLESGRIRGELERDKKREERRVAISEEKVATKEREIHSCQTETRELNLQVQVLEWFCLCLVLSCVLCLVYYLVLCQDTRQGKT